MTARIDLDYTTPCDPLLQAQWEGLGDRLARRHGLSAGQYAAGLLDLATGRLALIDPDRVEYGASLPKVGILLAWFALNPGAEKNLAPELRHELGLMIKASSNEAAARFTMQLGLANVQAVLNRHGFYDAARGGGLWVGKHYGVTGERHGDPVGGFSHAVTLRQLLRFYLLLDQGRLLSPEVSRVMREIFESPQIPHQDWMFVRSLSARGLTLLRKWGDWEDWFHDSALISGSGRRYLLAGLSRHPNGVAWLEDLAREADDLLAPAVAPRT